MQNVTLKEVGGNIIGRKMDTRFPSAMIKTIGMTEMFLQMTKRMSAIYRKKNTKRCFRK